MPDYKRKKVKKSLSRKKNRVDSDEIIMKPAKKRANSVIPQDDIKVIKGSSLKRKIKIRFFISVLAIVSAFFILLSFILPVSVYENIVNISALTGYGKYPLDVNGADIIDTVSNGSYYYVLTDTAITAYSNAGKLIFNDYHGLANPVISVSSTRAIVYDQGGKLLYVYNLSGKIYSYTAENEIITANISRNGTFAVSTHSDSYTSVVNIYDKNFKEIYTWNSAKDIINNVLLNSKGNRLAVTSLNAITGQFNSKMYILNFESANPLFTLELENSVALSITNLGKGIAIVSNDKYNFVHWSKFNTNEIKVSGETNLVRKGDTGLLLVINRANDRSDNTVVLVNKSGEKAKEFKINSMISDIQYSKGRVYYINDTNIHILDNDGNVLREGSCNYGVERFNVVAPNSIATIDDNIISRIDIQKGVN